MKLNRSNELLTYRFRFLFFFFFSFFLDTLSIFVISSHFSRCAKGRHPFPWNTKTLPFYMANTMDADVLATEGARASATVVLTQFIRKVLIHLQRVCWPHPCPVYMRDRNFNTLRPRQNCCHFAEDSFKCVFFSIQMFEFRLVSLKFVPNTIPALVQIMAWRQVIIWTNDG